MNMFCLRSVSATAIVVIAGACGQAAPAPVRQEGSAQQQPEAETATGPVAYEHPDAPLCEDVPIHAPVDGPLSDDPAVAEFQQYRADAGVRSDLEWVMRQPADPGKPRDFSAAESRELERRSPPDELREYIDQLKGRHPDTWAGSWLQHWPEVRMVVAFTADVDTRRAELEERFGAGAVKVTTARWSSAHLASLQEKIRPIFGYRNVTHSAGAREDLGVFGITLYVRDEPSVRAVLDLVGGEPICIEGADPAELIPEGPQPQAGAGWRFLTGQAVGVGSGPSAGAAQDEAEYAALWERARLTGERPAVDFSPEVVLWFEAGASCNGQRLDDVVVDTDAATVHARIVSPGKVGPCDLRYDPYTYAVAVPRDGLPRRFTMLLRPAGACPGCEPDPEVELR